MARTARTTRPVDTDKPRPAKPWMAVEWMRAMEMSEGVEKMEGEVARLNTPASSEAIAALHTFHQSAARDQRDAMLSGRVSYAVTEGRTFSWGACDMVPCWHFWKVER
jgi:hypothetical protein